MAKLQGGGQGAGRGGHHAHKQLNEFLNPGLETLICMANIKCCAISPPPPLNSYPNFYALGLLYNNQLYAKSSAKLVQSQIWGLKGTLENTDFYTPPSLARRSSKKGESLI